MHSSATFAGELLWEHPMLQPVLRVGPDSAASSAVKYRHLRRFSFFLSEQYIPSAAT
jgi:hypothetical protein